MKYGNKSGFGLMLALWACTPATLWAQFNIAMHSAADTAEAMEKGKAPLRPGVVVENATSWLNLVHGSGKSHAFQQVKLLNANGSPGSATISGQVGTAGTSGLDWKNNSKDHVLMEGYFSLIDQEFIEVDNLPADYQNDFSVRIFGNGQHVMLYTLNGTTNSIVPYGTFNGEFNEDVNQITFTGLKGKSFKITGNPTQQRNPTTSNIAGIQIFKGLPPVTPARISGSESPNVHSPGSLIDVRVDFLHEVTLSQAGGARLQLDFEGQKVDAIHTGPANGRTLTFTAKAPSVTTMKGKVLANSLSLNAGVTLKDRTQKDVRLAHGEKPLPNDQISVKTLSVYPPVPGLEPSPQFRYRIRKVGSQEWLTPFAFMTKCGTGGGYYAGGVGGWTHTYCNFEMANNTPVEVEISRFNPITKARVDIQTAVPHPRRKVRSWRIEDGKAYVIFENPSLFTVDIDGQMDENPVPRNPPVGHMTEENGLHSVSIFANPFILDKPDLKDPTVLAVEPGTVPPQTGDWKTLYFKPGVHQMWEGTWSEKAVFYVKDGKNYYIPGDALVHGTMRSDGAKNTLRIYGHGTLTQERITHALHQKPRLKNRGLTSAMRIGGAVGTRVEGISIMDSPDHSLWLNGPFNPDPATWNYVRWVKVNTWRANGDGISVDDNEFLEDSFIRVQDDGTYLKGRGVRRMVYWTDCNGTSLKINMISRMNPDNYLKQKFYVEDIDILYGRTHWRASQGHNVLGGGADFRLLSGRDGKINDSSHIVFRNINFEDPMPLRKMFGYSTKRSGIKHHVGVRFENVRSAANSVYGTVASMVGLPEGNLKDFVLDNVVLAGRQVSSRNDLILNEHVVNMKFANADPETITYLNHSGYGKWYMRKDWSTSVEPADHDKVKHTAQPGTLIVDGPAWAGTLDVAHANKAAVRLEYSGRLSISETLTLGDPKGGRGDLQLVDGDVVLRKADDKALAAVNGAVHIEKNGLLIWAGDRTKAIKELLSSGKITLGTGRSDVPQASAYDQLTRKIQTPDAPVTPPEPVLIGKVGSNSLYADYNNINPGFTTFWVRTAPGSAPRER